MPGAARHRVACRHQNAARYVPGSGHCQPGRDAAVARNRGGLASTSDGETLAQCKLKLSECLSGIRQEAERFRKDADGRTIFGDARKDRLTGLESREVAEVALSVACAAETPGCAIIIIIDRIGVYNVRFGRAVGDKVLQFFVDYLVDRKS